MLNGENKNKNHKQNNIIVHQKKHKEYEENVICRLGQNTLSLQDKKKKFSPF